MSNSSNFQTFTTLPEQGNQTVQSLVSGTYYFRVHVFPKYGSSYTTGLGSISISISIVPLPRYFSFFFCIPSHRIFFFCVWKFKLIYSVQWKTHETIHLTWTTPLPGNYIRSLIYIFPSCIIFIWSTIHTLLQLSSGLFYAPLYNGSDTSYTVRNLKRGTPFTFALRLADSQGVHSSYDLNVVTLNPPTIAYL